MCRSAVNDGSCSPWVMCSCSVVSGNQIRDSNHILNLLLVFLIIGSKFKSLHIFSSLHMITPR